MPPMSLDVGTAGTGLGAVVTSIVGAPETEGAPDGAADGGGSRTRTLIV